MAATLAISVTWVRIRPRTLVTLIASVAAIYLLAGELDRASPNSVLRSANWR